MYILNIVNSFIGKKGNIGARTSHIISALNEKNIENFSYSRGIHKNADNNINMGLFGHIPRLLNAFRIYIYTNFNHRKPDIKLFEYFIFSRYRNVHKQNKICHIWESSPDLIRYFKKKGYTTLLDVPIAPTKYAIETFKYYNENITIDYSYLIRQEQISFEIVDYIISPSQFVTDKLIDLQVDTKKIFTVPFGTDISTQEIKSFEKDYTASGIDYCFAGSINKRKGVEFLLEAWNDPAFDNDRLHLCGRLYPEIETLLKKYNFKNVITPGFVNTQEYFKKCDVYVFPSLLEGSSKSIYEAMNSGLSCIVTHNSGSVITNGVDGFLIDIGNSNELKQTMLKFKNNPALITQMGKNAMQTVRQYSWQKYAENVINIYTKVTNNG